jgi:hypothetical protein
MVLPTKHIAEAVAAHLVVSFGSDGNVRYVVVCPKKSVIVPLEDRHPWGVHATHISGPPSGIAELCIYKLNVQEQIAI